MDNIIQIEEQRRAAGQGNPGHSSLLIHSDTFDGDTTFTDSSPVPSFVAPNAMAHSTDQAKFGATSIKGDSTSDFLAVSNAWAPFDIATTQTFTIDAWVYPTLDASIRIMSNYSVSLATGWALSWVTGSPGNWRFFGGAGGSTLGTFNFGSGLLVLNQWQHICVVGSGGTVSGYVNGVFQSSQNGTVYYRDGVSYVANLDSGPTYGLRGYLDEVHISKTTALVPPSGGPVLPYTN